MISMLKLLAQSLRGTDEITFKRTMRDFAERWIANGTWQNVNGNLYPMIDPIIHEEWIAILLDDAREILERAG